jgi:hypothetical protein
MKERINNRELLVKNYDEKNRKRESKAKLLFEN